MTQTRATIITETPETTAMWFQVCLAERGYSSRLERQPGRVTVVASDGQAVAFEKVQKKG